MYYYIYLSDKKRFVRVIKRTDKGCVYEMPVREDKFQSFIPEIENVQKMDVVLPRSSKKKEDIRGDLKIGKIYTIQNTNYLFRVVKIIEYTDRDGSTAILQLINPEETKNSQMSFSYLGETDCERFEIDYQKYYLLLPDNLLQWEDVENVKNKYDGSDLSTYPVEGDNGVRYLTIKLGGFDNIDNKNYSVILTPTGSVIDLELFILSLEIELKMPIKKIDGFGSINKGKHLVFSILTGGGDGSIRLSENHIVDYSGSITILVDLGIHISNNSLKDLSIADLLRVTWDDSFSVKKDSKYDIKEFKNAYDKLVLPYNYFFKVEDRIWRNIIREG
jgi:hypothetical protein